MATSKRNFTARTALGIVVWSAACVIALLALVTAVRLDLPWLIGVVALIGVAVVVAAGVSTARWWRAAVAAGRREPFLDELGRWLMLSLSTIAVFAAAGFLLVYLLQAGPGRTGLGNAQRHTDSPVAVAFLAFISVVILVGAIAAIARAAQPRRAMGAVRYLDWLVQHDLPLAAGLDAAVQGECGRTAMILGALRDFLGRGASVAEALRLAAPELPDHLVRRIEAAERLGRLKPTLHRLAAAPVLASSQDDAGFAIYRYYPAVLTVMVAFVGGIVAVFILPKYVSILRDFRIPPPPPTRLLLQFWQFDVAGYVWVVLIVVPLVWLGRAAVPPAARRRNFFPFLRAAWDYLVAPLPLVGRAARDRAMIDVCDVLADAIESGHTLDEGLAEAETIPMSAVVAARVRRWRAAAGGAPPAESARAAGMPPLLVGMLAAAGDRPAEALRFLSRYHAARLARATVLLRTLYVLAVAVIGGAVVAFMALSLFLPIRALVDATNPYPFRM